MSGLPWFKCYPRDFNDGMVGLTLEERGAYVTILNVIYARGGPVPDDAHYFRALLTCSPKTWTKVRAALIAKRKLFEVSEAGETFLMNRRAADEIEENREKSRKFSEGGARGGRKTQARFKENSHLGQAGLEGGSSDTDTEADKTPLAPQEGEAPLDLKPFAKLLHLAAYGSFAELSETIFLLQPVTGGKRKATRPDVSRAFEAAIRRRKGTPGEILRALRAYYALPDCTKDGGRFASGAGVMLNADRWRDFLPRPEPAPGPIDPAVAAHRLAHWRRTGEWKREWGERPLEAA